MDPRFRKDDQRSQTTNLNIRVFSYKTHDLEFLLERCIVLTPEFILLQDASKYLNSYANNARYPNDYFFINDNEIQQAILMAEKILQAITKKVKNSTGN